MMIDDESGGYRFSMDAIMWSKRSNYSEEKSGKSRSDPIGRDFTPCWIWQEGELRWSTKERESEVADQLALSASW